MKHSDVTELTFAFVLTRFVAGCGEKVDPKAGVLPLAQVASVLTAGRIVSGFCLTATGRLNLTLGSEVIQ